MSLGDLPNIPAFDLNYLLRVIAGSVKGRRPFDIVNALRLNGSDGIGLGVHKAAFLKIMANSFNGFHANTQFGGKLMKKPSAGKAVFFVAPVKGSKDCISNIMIFHNNQQKEF